MSVTIETNLGEIKIELFCEECPKTAENFLALCASNYYDNCEFHRNIKDFIVQTGDPTNIGTNGESIWKKPFEDEIKPELKHNTRGIVAMANSGPNTNQSQFYITYASLPELDLKYTVFGKMIDGFDTLDAIERSAVDAQTKRPLNPIFIKNVVIHANPIALKEEQ